MESPAETVRPQRETDAVQLPAQSPIREKSYRNDTSPPRDSSAATETGVLVKRSKRAFIHAQANDSQAVDILHERQSEVPSGSMKQFAAGTIDICVPIDENSTSPTAMSPEDVMKARSPSSANGMSDRAMPIQSSAAPRFRHSDTSSAPTGDSAAHDSFVPMRQRT